MIGEKRICNICNEEKDINSFNKAWNTGIRKICKSCQSKKAHNKNKNKESYLNSRKAARLKSRYGLSLDDYNKLFNAQLGCCKICGIHQSLLKTRLSVDHCHKNNLIRGLLCGDCNRGIGLLKDSIEIMNNAIKYLTNGIS